MGKQAFSRASRLGTSIQKELASMINAKQLKEFKDSRFAGLISVIDVRVTNGYQHLDIFLSVLEEEHRKGVLEVMKEAIPSLRGEICRRFKLRVAPSIHFHLDNSIERSFEVWSLLDQISSSEPENKPKS